MKIGRKKILSEAQFFFAREARLYTHEAIQPNIQLSKKNFFLCRWKIGIFTMERLILLWVDHSKTYIDIKKEKFSNE